MSFIRTIFVFLFSVALSISFSPLASAREENPSVPMLSGGVGEEDYDQLQSSRSHYNVRLLFTETSGAYVSDVKVSLRNAKGVEIATTTTEGPVLFLKLKPGVYSVKATVSGVVKTEKFTVSAKGMTFSQVRFPLSDNGD